jgi:hypothetical protein
MRILGVIAGFAVVLFLIGWWQLDVDGKSVKTGERFSSRDVLKQDAAAPLKKFHVESATDSLWTIPTWLQRPIGIVRYPDFPHFNFLPNGD